MVFLFVLIHVYLCFSKRLKLTITFFKENSKKRYQKQRFSMWRHTCLWIVCIKQSSWKSNQQRILVFNFWRRIRARSEWKRFFWKAMNGVTLRDDIHELRMNHLMEEGFRLQRLIYITFRVYRIICSRFCCIKGKICENSIVRK